MYECPNCRGNLLFNISLQQLQCVACSSAFDPYQIHRETDAEDTFESTVYSCPQCGGEMIALENSVVEFCVYCGGSNIISSRLTRQKRPRYIIPFTQTKEDCISAYRNKMKKAIFAPSELKNPKNLENFRAIYVPYWSYRINQRGNTVVKGEKVHQEGNYTVTEHFNLISNVDAFYRGFSHDASSGVPDDLTERVAPFGVKNMKEFTPSYLSGFYADTEDVNYAIYTEESALLADELTFKQIRNEFAGYTIKDPESTTMYDRILHTQIEDIDSTMYPIWFLTYRNKDRVMYSAVNGQTGKVVADIPIAPLKYVLGSILLAIPIFLLLNLLFTFSPSVVLGIAMVFALIGIINYTSQMQKLLKQENRLDDKGYVWRTGKSARTIQSGKKGSVRTTNNKVIGIIVGMIFVVPFIYFIGAAALTNSFFRGIILLGVVIAAIVFSVIGIKKMSEIKFISKYITSAGGTEQNLESKPIVTMGGIWGFILPLIALLISWLIWIVSPVNDAWYYGATVMTSATVLLTFFEIIRKYNLLSTRKIPNFHDRGGNQNA